MEPDKFKKFNLKSFIKQTNSSRLQSLRLPRDLSLGGTQVQPKKVYKPNVNAVRNKNKCGKLRNTEKCKSFNIKEKQDKSKDRFIQSTGVFSEGIGPNPLVKLKIEKKVPQYDEKHIKKIDSLETIKHSINKPQKIVDNNVLNDLKTEISDSDSDEKFPFAPTIWDKNTKLSEVKSDSQKCLNELPIEYENESDLQSPILTLWQLPDSFACKGARSSDFQLLDMPEGQIGKISVHRSGKFEISIANTKLMMDSTMDSFSEELVCLDTVKSNCFVLGELTNRFVLSPDWGILL